MASTRSSRKVDRRVVLWTATGLGALLLVIAYWVALAPPSAGSGSPREGPSGSVPARDSADSDVQTAGQWPLSCEKGSPHVVGRELSVAAEEVVAGYERTGTCLLHHAGYLDHDGSVWGCVVEGPGWVDVCVVSGSAEGGRSLVRTVRLEVPDGLHDAS